MCTNCSPDESPVKQIQIPSTPFDFWRDGVGNQPDGTTDHTDDITHNGDVGIGLTTAPQAALDLNGAAILRPAILANQTANATLPVAAVDDHSAVQITQTSPGITLTLPAPTVSQPGRLFVVENVGAVDVTVGGKAITPGTGIPFIWSGAAWIPLGSSGVVADFWRSGTGATLPDGTTDPTENVSRSGNTGIGITDPSTLTARLDVDGAQVLRPATIANSAVANATVGTAATTVDIASTLVLNQTTNGINRTLPNPTNAQAGRLLYVTHNGTATGTTVAGRNVDPGETLIFVWDGNSWNPHVAGSPSADFFRSGTGATLPDAATDFTENVSHNGNLGLGIADPSTLAARLDVSGAQVLRSVNVGNRAANGAIGTAAATVDIASTILVPQTTQNIIATIPNPTNAQAGRILAVVNNGTAQIKVQGVYINPGQGASFEWTGASWALIGEAPDYLNVGASRNINLNDHLKTLLAAAPITLTVQANTAQYMIFRIRQSTAAGVITMAAGAGMTLVAPYGSATSAMNGDHKIVEVIGATIYIT